MTAPRQGSPGRRFPRLRGQHPPMPDQSRGLVSTLPRALWAADGAAPPVAACQAPCTASPGNASASLVHARGRRPLPMPGWRSSPPLPSSAGLVALSALLPVPWHGRRSGGVGLGLPGWRFAPVDGRGRPRPCVAPPPGLGSRLAGGVGGCVNARGFGEQWCVAAMIGAEADSERRAGVVPSVGLLLVGGVVVSVELAGVKAHSKRWVSS